MCRNLLGLSKLIITQLLVGNTCAILFTFELEPTAVQLWSTPIYDYDFLWDHRLWLQHRCNEAVWSFAGDRPTCKLPRLTEYLYIYIFVKVRCQGQNSQRKPNKSRRPKNNWESMREIMQNETGLFIRTLRPVRGNGRSWGKHNMSVVWITIVVGKQHKRKWKLNSASTAVNLSN